MLKFAENGKLFSSHRFVVYEQGKKGKRVFEGKNFMSQFGLKQKATSDGKKGMLTTIKMGIGCNQTFCDIDGCWEVMLRCSISSHNRQHQIFMPLETALHSQISQSPQTPFIHVRDSNDSSFTLLRYSLIRQLFYSPRKLIYYFR